MIPDDVTVIVIELRHPSVQPTKSRGGATDEATAMFYRAALGALLLALVLGGWVRYNEGHT